MKRQLCILMLHLKLQFEEKIEYVKNKRKAFKKEFPDLIAKWNSVIERLVYLSICMAYDPKFKLSLPSIFYLALSLFKFADEFCKNRKRLWNFFQNGKADDQDKDGADDQNRFFWDLGDK